MSLLPLPSALAVYKRVAGADPGAGVEFNDSVPAGKTWVLLSVTVVLVQGATQTPWPSLVIDDGATAVFQGLAGTAAQNASISVRYTWAPGLATLGSGASIANSGALPFPMILSPGWRVRSSTTGLGANSDYGVPSYFVCELG